MQFLSPVQLVFVLWLLAAAAPAATVLLNGSFVPMEAVATSNQERKAEDRAQRDERITSASIIAHPVAEQAAGDDQFDRNQQVVSLVGSAMRDHFSGPASSVLQTSVQRHRPKSA